MATSGIIRSVKPIVHGIEALGNQEEVYIPEKGLMSQLAASINRVSEKLKTQSYALRKRRPPGPTGSPEYPTISGLLCPWSWAMPAPWKKMLLCLLKSGKGRDHPAAEYPDEESDQ